MPEKTNMLTEIIQKVGDALNAKLKTLNIETVAEFKKTVLGLVEEEMGGNLKGLQDIIAKAVLQQIPQSQVFSPHAGREYDPEIGIKSMPKARAKEVANMLRMASGNGFLLSNEEKEASKKSFSDMLTNAKALNTSAGQDGGFLIPTEFVSEVLRKLVKISIFRGLARNFNGVGLQGSIPRETGTVSINYAAELQDLSLTKTQFKLGNLIWSLNKRFALTPVSRDLFKFSDIDVISLLSTMYAEQSQLKDDDIFMTGKGSGTPLGLRVERTGMTTVAQAGVNLDWTDFNNIKFGMKVQYRNQGACWIMHNDIINKMTQLKDDNNRPLMLDRGPAGLAAENLPDMTVGFVLGLPVVEDNFIPTNLGAGANASEIFLAAMKRAYAIFDSGSPEMRTTEEGVDAFQTDQMYVRMISYDDGKPSIPEACVIGTGIK